MAMHFAVRTCLRRAATMTLAAASVCSLVYCSTASAAPKTKRPKESRRSDTKEIENLEQQWRTAIVSGDAATMDKLLSDDFLGISARGTLSDKQQYLQRIAAHTTQLSTFDLMDMKVRVQPGSAVAVSQAHIAGMLEGRPIEGVFRYTKVYGRFPNGVWRMTNFEATRVSRAAAGSSDMNQGTPLGDRSAPPSDR